MAHVLMDHGVGKGDRVAVFAKNRIECLDAFFGASKIGAILVPLNIRLASQELRHIIGKTRPKMLFYDPSLRDISGRLRCEADEMEIAVMGSIELDGDPPLLALMREASDERVKCAGVSLEDPAMILSTGGTTGRPKGAILSHGLIYWNSVNTITSWGLRPDDTQPLLFPLFHTGGWNVLTLPFVHLGARTVLMGDFDAETTLRVIEKEQCTIIIGVPTMFLMMSQSPAFGRTDFSSVRVFISGGAPCPVAIMQPYWELGKHFKMGYGLTEVGPNNFHLPESEIHKRPSSVGFPVFHCEARTVDDAGRDLGANEVGELLLRGPHIFSGYWDEPEETAKTIEPNGWVHTGDLAMRDDQGFYYIVGRKKDMFISGGENVYPPEIEEQLFAHPAIMEAAVIGVPDEKWGEVGKAFIVLRPDMTADADEIRRYLTERLAKYKVPKYYEFRDSLPKSAAGKILKRELH